MEARARNLLFLYEEGKVIIPFFQRTYVWNRDNWEDLLEELSNENRSTNFLGAIILKQIPSISGEPKQLEVIDGQQRLTTLSILLKAFYDTFPEEIRENCKGDINGILYYKKDRTSREYDTKIQHSYIDGEAYKKVMIADVNLDLNSINEKSHKILQCYKFFREKLAGYPVDVRCDLYNKIVNESNKMLVVIDIDQNENEQSIFDTLNTTGVRLTVAEIVKNAIFKRAIELSNRDDTIKLYENTWQKTFLKDKETVDYWEAERTTGRLKRDNIEILLHCIGVIKGFYDPDKHTLSDLSRLYKEQLAKINSIDELKEFINEIIDYAQIYREKIVTFDKSDAFSFDDSFKRLLHIMEELEISTFHPLLLNVFKKYQNDAEKIKEILGKIEKFVIRNMLAKIESVKNYNKLCKQFINEVSNLDEKLNEIPWDKVESGLHNISNDNALLLLFWIELYRLHKDNKYDKKELKYIYSLEHIMPQNWEEYWDFDKVPHPDSSLSPEKQKQDREEKIYWIGNMTLLTSSLNSALKNLSFEKKMNGEGQRKGIKAYAALSITKDDIVAPFENGDRVWDEKKIKTRTEKLMEEIREIWG
ncbi:MAG: DUF262 domain-containing HNH endonuclease family protein [candidate division WOR-3 bacterium]